MNNFLWLEHWYNGLCDGMWEHAHGIRVETLHNPGWRFRVDLNGTPFDQAPDMVLKQMTVSEREWMTCRVQNATFDGVGGPLMLGPILQVFRNWIESY